MCCILNTRVCSRYWDIDKNTYFHGVDLLVGNIIQGLTVEVRK